MQPQTLFVHKQLETKRPIPVNYVQLGVLGDLCLTRVNREIFDYHVAHTEIPFGKVFMCDVEVKGEGNAETEFLAKLYDRCVGRQCERDYFTRPFLEAFNEKLKGKKIASNHKQELLKELFHEYARGCLTDLGLFVVTNYQCTKSEADRQVVFSQAPDDADWIFYLAIPPERYKEFIDHAVSYFSERERESGTEEKPTKKAFLLEKPLQTTSAAAANLTKTLNKYHAKDENIKFFAVDHYAAKWSLSQIPYLLEAVPSFHSFVDEADQIIIELLERQTTPPYRFDFMVNTGLYFDMMPHALVPLQFLFVGKEVTWNAISCLAGCYTGFRDEVANWQRKHNQHKSSKKIGEKDLKVETYFYIQLDLTVKDPLRETAPRKVTAFIHAGKGMAVDRKRVIIKRRHIHDCPPNDDHVASVTIDIARETFYHTQLSGVSFPERVLSHDAAKKQISGYAKILYDAMEYLVAPNKRNSQTLIEMMDLSSATRIIKNIEDIRYSLTHKTNCDWLGGTHLREYLRNEVFFLDDQQEKVFLYPFDYVKH